MPTTADKEFKGAAVQTVTTNTINDVDTAVSIQASGGWPVGGSTYFTMVLDRGTSLEEKVLCSTRSGLGITIASRGYDDTAAVGHSSGATAEHCLAATDLDALFNHATNTGIDDHTQYMLKASYAGSGAHTARPAFGKKGATWLSTDTSGVNKANAGWYIDTGSAWDRLTPGPWTAWTPTITVTNGGGGTSTVTKSFTNATYLYRNLPGATTEVYVDADVALTGTQQFTGLLLSSPVASARAQSLFGEGMNDIMRARVEDSGGFGNVIAAFPPGAYNPAGAPYVGQWLTDSAVRHFRICGSYPT
jgi:hypothetical protein